MTIGERIKQRRKELNLTQQELADKMGYKDRSAICQIEKDRNNSITTDRIAELANALECSPASLMGWTEEIRVEHSFKVNNISASIEYDSTDIEKALKFYEQYKKSIPQVQSAVDALLKSTQSDS